MKTLGVGLVGTGYMGKCHALAWNAVRPVFGDVPAVRLVHLGEVDATLAATRASELGFERSSGDWRAVVDDPEVDVISITTPNRFHAEMATAALAAGKHVWCEKPMATSLADAQDMRDAARASGKAAILGYNYIQNPVIRHIGKLLRDGAIGDVNHIRVEMDEDFMADPSAVFGVRHEASSGHGAIDDFGVHPLSLIHTLVGPIERLVCDMAKPYASRIVPGGTRPVEVFDIATILFRLATGASGVIALNRCAWGRKGRIALQIFGARGSILFDQERFNEFQLYLADDPATEQGFRTVLTAPVHAPYGRFIPAPGHGLGFNDLKIIECRELIDRMRGEAATVIDFDAGLEIERAVDAMARSSQEGRWIELTSQSR